MSLTITVPPANGHFISLTQASEMTARYRENIEIVLDPAYKNQSIFAQSETFNREAFDEVLSKEGCAGLRIYYGMDEELKVHAIIVGADQGNNDILPETLQNALMVDNSIIEEGQRCPSLCPPPSPLNK